ncbi:MAG: aldo/keto reductase [Planctomycetota bacterium]|nr:MAG: aldo/keto reductase [Planctomycetota bacterium]
MQYRTLGSSGLSISVVGLGTWAIGGGDWKFGWGDQDETSAVGAIVRAVELGINWIDTAAIYGEGRSETLVAKAIESIAPNDRPLIATKCGRVALGNGEIGKSLRRASIVAECEGSLRRLKTDVIDLYQLHWPEPDEEIEEGWQTLVELKQQGKVRHIGVSNHSVEQMKRLQAIHPIVSLQPPYSMIARDIEAEILPFCQTTNVGVVCYSPMGKGLLTGRFTADRVAALSDKDHRTKDPRFQSPQLEINLEFVQKLDTLARSLNWSVTDVAIAWTLRRPELTSAIVGARSPEQIEQTVTAGDRVLDEAGVATIAAALEDRELKLAALPNVARARV